MNLNEYDKYFIESNLIRIMNVQYMLLTQFWWIAWQENLLVRDINKTISVRFSYTLFYSLY